MKTKSKKAAGKPRGKAKAETIDAAECLFPMRWRSRMYCEDTDTGCVILTGEQVRALMAAVDISLSVARPKSGSGAEFNLLSAIEILDHTFSLGIGECGCGCDD